MPSSRSFAPTAASRLTPPSQASRLAVQSLHHRADRQMVHADRLPRADSRVEILLEGLDADVRRNRLQLGPVQGRANLVAGQVRHPAPLDVFPAHFAEFFQGSGEVLLGRIADRIELDGDAFGPFFCGGRFGSGRQTGLARKANKPRAANASRREKLLECRSSWELSPCAGR